MDLGAELTAMIAEDDATRARLAARLAEIVDLVGWPGRSVAGADGTASGSFGGRSPGGGARKVGWR